MSCIRRRIGQQIDIVDFGDDPMQTTCSFSLINPIKEQCIDQEKAKIAIDLKAFGLRTCG